jgi:hypothetical protein
VSIERLENRYLTLAVTGGRPTLAHWLSRSRAEVDAILKKPLTTTAFKQQAEAALRLADALEARHGVQVYWEERLEQGAKCPECSLIFGKQARWEFDYPDLPTSSFATLLRSNGIVLAGAAVEGNGFHTLSPDEEGGWRVVHQFQQDPQRLWLRITPVHRCYRQTLELLRVHNASIRENGVLYHVYPASLVSELVVKEKEYARDLRQRPAVIGWGFQEVWQSSRPAWRMYAARVVTR